MEVAEKYKNQLKIFHTNKLGITEQLQKPELCISLYWKCSSSSGGATEDMDPTPTLNSEYFCIKDNKTCSVPPPISELGTND